MKLLVFHSLEVFKDSFKTWLVLLKVSYFFCSIDWLNNWLCSPFLATAAAKKTQRTQKKREGQIHTSTHFYRPKTLKLARKPKYERHAISKENKMDAYAIIKKPAVSESSMKKIEVFFFSSHSYYSLRIFLLSLWIFVQTRDRFVKPLISFTM